MTRFASVNEQMDAIRRNALEVIPEDGLVRKLERSLKQNEPLRIKQGFDPTRPDLHIGHVVSLRKLRVFQELGHEVTFVIGDYTARVGDPTGRSETRPRLSGEEIDAHARTYAEQAGMVLDLSRVRIEYNSRWLAPLDLAALLELTATYTVARMLERDDFAKRYAQNRPISVMEFMYPLMQAYDSVALRADVELGGTDQKFNLLVARTVQERYGQEPQICLIMPLLRGTDGEQKMSKSYDNYIGITEPAEEMFGKTMSIPDAVLDEWWQLASGLHGDALEQALAHARQDPYQSKRALGRTIAALYHDAAAAERAEERFDRMFKERAAPDEMPEIDVSLGEPVLRHEPGRGVLLSALLVRAGLAESNSEAARLIQQGAIAVDDQKIDDRAAYVSAEQGSTPVVRRGKRQYVRVRFVL